MKANKIVTDCRLAQWAGLIRQRTESGLSVNAFCRSRGLSRSQYFYWQRKVREAALENMVPLPEGRLIPAGFTQVQVKEASGQFMSAGSKTHAGGQIRIEIKGIRIIADSGYPPELIASLLREVTPQC